MSSADSIAGASGAPFAGDAFSNAFSNTGGNFRDNSFSKKSPEGPMSDGKPVDNSRRNLLVATCAAGGVAGVAALTPLIGSFEPSEKAKAAGAPVEVDIGGMAVGELRTF